MATEKARSDNPGRLLTHIRAQLAKARRASILPRIDPALRHLPSARVIVDATGSENQLGIALLHEAHADVRPVGLEVLDLDDQVAVLYHALAAVAASVTSCAKARATTQLAWRRKMM